MLLGSFAHGLNLVKILLFEPDQVLKELGCWGLNMYRYVNSIIIAQNVNHEHYHCDECSDNNT